MAEPTPDVFDFAIQSLHDRYPKEFEAMTDAERIAEIEKRLNESTRSFGWTEGLVCHADYDFVTNAAADIIYSLARLKAHEATMTRLRELLPIELISCVAIVGVPERQSAIDAWRKELMAILHGKEPA